MMKRKLNKTMYTELSDDKKAIYYLSNILPVCGECEHIIKYFVNIKHYIFICSKNGIDTKYFSEACDKFGPGKN